MKNQHDYEDAARRLRRMQRKKEMKRKKRQQAVLRQLYKAGIAVVLLAVIITVIIVRREKNDTPENAGIPNTGQQPAEDGETDSVSADSRTGLLSVSEPAISGNGNPEENSDAQEEPAVYQYTSDEDTLQLGGELISSHAIFVDPESGMILAGKGEKDRIVPASMTKVLTLLVAVENIKNPDDTFTITGEITDYCYVNDCSAAGFGKDETVTVKDLMYGTILPSGGDAALGLAYYVADSQEAFVERMNQKLQELGLSETAHFTNCIGIYDENHYCSVYDLAVIMNAAIENETCREVLSAHTYTTSPTEQHPEGISLSNWFLRRIEDKDTGGEVICGKTGYVGQSGSCAASYGKDEKNHSYICVTANANSQWRCINDHAYLYKLFSGTQSGP